MRCLWRNKVPFWYCLYEGKQMILDQNGYETGEFEVKYSAPVLTYGNVSSTQGSAQLEQFGNLIAYEKVIIVEDHLPVDENTLFYIDCTPENGAKPDYIVRKISKSYYGMSIAVSRVTAS